MTYLPHRAVGRAQLLAGAVRDTGADDIAAILTPLDRRGLYELAVTLAAMVPTDMSPTELLAWNDAEMTPRVVNAPRVLRPHGTHAAFNRHRGDGSVPCDACWSAERDYQRGRKRRARLTVIA